MQDDEKSNSGLDTGGAFFHARWYVTVGIIGWDRREKPEFASLAAAPYIAGSQKIVIGSADTDEPTGQAFQYLLKDQKRYALLPCRGYSRTGRHNRLIRMA